MSDVKQAPSTVRYLGGEGGHRGFFGGTASKGRSIALAIIVVSGMVGMIVVQQAWVLLVAVLAGGLTFLLTMKTHRGSLIQRRQKRSRWKARQRLGTDVFTPYDDEAWEKLDELGRSASKADQAEAERLKRQMRANPDGADGMGWLQYGANVPGIAWHAPVGEQDYLSVAFSVSGQLRGMETAEALLRASSGWGRFLARRAAPSSLISDIQPMTRVLPPDSARQQLWVADRLERETPDRTWTDQERATFMEQTRSYDEVIRLASAGSMVQRHYVVVSWPLTQQFTDAASKFGKGRDAWRSLMADEISTTVRGLRDAREGDVAPLTAKQTAALMLHQQNPHLPIDLTRKVSPGRFGLPSHDEFSAHVVDGIDPTFLGPNDPIENAPAVQWWHRTAAIHAENLAVAGRTPLWLLDLLIGHELRVVRTIAFHLHLIPAGQAKAKARKDAVSDGSAIYAAQQKGRLINDETQMSLGAAERRKADLAAGSHHHGVEWVGYITISATSRDELAKASRQLEEACATGLGIERLDWQDSFQSAASGATWPIGRGLRPDTPTVAGRALTRLAGRSDKEAIS